MKISLSKESKAFPKTKRERLKDLYWKDEIAWLGHKSVGYFCPPRTLPLILTVLKSKDIGGKDDPGPAYVELLSRHYGDGVVEMSDESEHAYDAGYISHRGPRTWRERMSILEEFGFIKRVSNGHRQFGIVFIVHPAVVLERLREKQLISARLWENYQRRQLASREETSDVLLTAARGLKKGKKTVRTQ